MWPYGIRTPSANAARIQGVGTVNHIISLVSHHPAQLHWMYKKGKAVMTHEQGEQGEQGELATC